MPVWPTRLLKFQMLPSCGNRFGAPLCQCRLIYSQTPPAKTLPDAGRRAERFQTASFANFTTVLRQEGEQEIRQETNKPPPFGSKTLHAAVRFVVAPTIVPSGENSLSVEVAPNSTLNERPTTLGSKSIVSPMKVELLFEAQGAPPANCEADPPSYVANLKE